MRTVYLNQTPARSFQATGKCLNCDGELPKRRRKYCSDKCSMQFYWEKVEPNILDWNKVRKRILKRDNHTCAFCNKSKELHVDHIIPIAIGGELFKMSNLQVLCKDCHKIKTKSDIKKIVAKRRTKKILVKGQKKLGCDEL